MLFVDKRFSLYLLKAIWIVDECKTGGKFSCRLWRCMKLFQENVLTFFFQENVLTFFKKSDIIFKCLTTLQKMLK